ncbi:hypothetical protein BOX15_Mlig019880g3, partial [Macrostomum lignano]
VIQRGPTLPKPPCLIYCCVWRFRDRFCQEQLKEHFLSTIGLVSLASHHTKFVDKMDQNGGVIPGRVANGNGVAGSTNGHGPSKPQQPQAGDPDESLKWRVGLRNASGKFLTAEPFGFKLNASGASLKMRQTWVLVPDPEHPSTVCLKSHLNRFLSTDKDGLVSCSSEEAGPETRFIIEYAGDGVQWALKSAQHGLYFSGEEDRVKCFSKAPVWWTCQLALHPQVHVKNLNRGRYLRLGSGEISADRVNPWGAESLITLMKRDGRVAIRASDGRYLARGGELLDRLDEAESLFSIQVHCGPCPGLAFKDSAGRFLTNIGATGTSKTKNQTVSKDELFVLEDSYPQIAVKAFNGRYASIKQGQDLNANQSDIDVTETYQLEFHAASGKWRFRTKDDKFWKLSTVGNGISATGDSRDQSTLFAMEYQPKGRVALKCSNGSYLSAKKLGAVNATGSEVKSEEQFQLVLLNRPIVVFRCDFGFVGIKNGRLECNLVSYDAFNLEVSDSGFYHIRGSEGFWCVQADGSISFKGERPEEFLLEFRSRSCVAIQASNGCYVRGEQNGTMRADADEIRAACLWEY